MSENALRVIRVRVFDCNQTQMAEIAGASQTSVSYWEKGEREPDRHNMELIRAEARRRGIAWDDRWFFDAAAIPADIQPSQEAAA